MQAGRSFKVYNSDNVRLNLHADQNEKRAMYGVTHAVARDGYSGMIIGHKTMAIKSNLTIYKTNVLVSSF